MAFKQAVKRDAKIRLALAGSAGSGKSYTALKIASYLAGAGRIAAVDTEHGSLSKYAHTDACGGPGSCVDPSHFDFDVYEPGVFDPLDLIEQHEEARRAGYAVFLPDSLSHYWMGPGGELDMVDKAVASSKTGNSFAAWKKVTPVHNRLIDTLLSSTMHIIATMRTKTEWVIDTNERGKQVPRKVGMAPVMRDGIEFEFDVVGDLDQDNTLTVTKSRCSALSGAVIQKPGRDMAEKLIAWLAGAPLGAGVASAVPGPLVGLVASLNAPGGVSRALGLLRDQLIEACPVDGAEQYRIILEKSGVKPKGNTVAVIKAACLLLYNTAQAARDAANAVIVGDEDLPENLRPAGGDTNGGQFEAGWISEDEPAVKS